MQKSIKVTIAEIHTGTHHIKQPSWRSLTLRPPERFARRSAHLHAPTWGTEPRQPSWASAGRSPARRRAAKAADGRIPPEELLMHHEMAIHRRMRRAVRQTRWLGTTERTGGPRSSSPCLCRSPAPLGRFVQGRSGRAPELASPPCRLKYQRGRHRPVSHTNVHIEWTTHVGLI